MKPSRATSESTNARVARVQGLQPAAGGVLVMGGGVDDAVGGVVGQAMDAAGLVGVHAELDDEHPGQPHLPAQPLDGLGDDAEVLGHQRQRIQLGPLQRPEQRDPRARASRCRRRAVRARAGTAQ